MVLKRPVASRFAAQQRDILAPEDSQGAPVSGRKKSMNINELCPDLLENETVARDLAAKNPSFFVVQPIYVPPCGECDTRCIDTWVSFM